MLEENKLIGIKTYMYASITFGRTKIELKISKYNTNYKCSFVFPLFFEKHVEFQLISCVSIETQFGPIGFIDNA